MLTSKSEKFLHGEFERQRNRALVDSSTFPSTGRYSLADLEVGVAGQGVNDPETYLVDSQPADNEATPKGNAIDIRRIPGHD